MFKRNKNKSGGLSDKPTKIPMPPVKPPRIDSKIIKVFNSNTKEIEEYVIENLKNQYPDSLKQLKQKLYDISVGLDMIHYDITDRGAICEYDELKEDVEECIRMIGELENKINNKEDL
jgi:hypothetical protein